VGVVETSCSVRRTHATCVPFRAKVLASLCSEHFLKTFAVEGGRGRSACDPWFPDRRLGELEDDQNQNPALTPATVARDRIHHTRERVSRRDASRALDDTLPSLSPTRWVANAVSRDAREARCRFRGLPSQTREIGAH